MENNTDTKTIQVSVDTTMFQRRDKIITVKLKAPKDFFAVGELLSQFSKFETIETFFETLVRNGADTYLENAKKAIAKVDGK